MDFRFKKPLNKEDEQMTGSKEQKKRKELPTGSVQSIIPIRRIENGVIVTTDDRYVKIMEVLPINFTLRSDEEQNNIIQLFASWLKIAPVKLQFKVINRRADSFKIVNNIMAATEKETHEKCRVLGQDYINFVRQLSGTEAVSRRFFLVFEYEPTSTRRKTENDIIAEMNDTARKVRSGLMTCGNEVVIPPDDDYFQAEILFLFYNPGTSCSEQFADRVVRVTSDVMKYNHMVEDEDEYPNVPICDYVAPMGIEFKNPDYMIIDGMYQSIMMVKKNGYPSVVYAGWMSALIETGDGIDVDIILHKEPRNYTRDKVSFALRMNRVKASGRYDTDTDYEEIIGSIDAASYIKEGIANGEDFYHIFIFITVRANTLEELQKKQEEIHDYLYAKDVETRPARYRMEDAFQAVTPLLIYKAQVMQLASRNVMTSGAASLYPFTSCELCDENGIVLGVNRRYQSLVNLDVFNTKKYKNANISILGTSGSGKTYSELTMALRMRIQGIQTFIISPDKAHEFRRVCAHIDGSFIRISPGSNSCINIMDIRPVVNPVAELLDGYDESENDKWLYQKANQLRTFFKLLIPDITNEEEQLVDEAIIKTYSLFNITEDNNSLYNPDGSLKPMPIIGDLYDVIVKNPDLRRVGNILGRFVTGSAKSFNQQTNVDLQNKFIVFDLSDLNDTLKAVGMFIVMDFLWTKIKANRTEKKALFIDEGWQLIGASTDTAAAEFVYRIFKIIRGYGGSAVFATQDISDLFAFQNGKYGKAILSNSRIKVILSLEEQEAKAVKDVLQLTNNEVRSIINFPRGEGLLCVNNNRLPILIRASKTEDELFTTDPVQLREIMRREQAVRDAEKKMKRNNNPTVATVIPQTDSRSEFDKKDVLTRGSADRHGVDPKIGGQAEEDPYEKEAQMRILAIEQSEKSTLTRDMNGTIIPNSDDDLPIVPVEKVPEIFEEDEITLLSEARQKKEPTAERNGADTLLDAASEQKSEGRNLIDSLYGSRTDF